MALRVLRHLTAPLKIVLGCTLIAIGFGVLHDLFSASVCVEYFTVHHPKVVESEHWLVMALVWGFLATFWVGAFGGFWLAWCSQIGSRPPLEVRRVLVMVSKAAAGVLVIAPLVWAALFWVGTVGLRRADPSANVTSLDARLVASGTMHALSYFLAAVSFVVIGVRSVWLRYRTVT